MKKLLATLLLVPLAVAFASPVYAATAQSSKPSVTKKVGKCAKKPCAKKHKKHVAKKPGAKHAAIAHPRATAKTT